MPTRRQRENIAKYLFDLSKISFAVPVIGTVVSKEPFHFGIFWGGIFFTITTFVLALILDRGDITND